MTRTHNEAIAILTATNDEAAAFAVAQQDEGLSADVTFEEWVSFARACIAERKAVAQSVVSYFGYYG